MTEQAEPDVAGNLAALQARLAEAARSAGRDPAAVKLLAACKRQSEARVRAALAAGQRLFGENKVQEGEQRWPPLKAEGYAVELHLIGPLQTNKAVEAVELVDVIQTLDRAKLAKRLNHAMARTGRTVPCYVQVNTGEEPQKAGIAPGELSDFLAYCRDEEGLTVTGLMAIPPAEEHPAPHFALLAKAAERHNLPNLSMGMSGDYETAVSFGATHVRLGTALFGPRD